MDVSVGVWWLGGCVNGCVASWVVVRWVWWMDVSVVWWSLVGCVDGCVGRWVLVGWMSPLCGGRVDVWNDISASACSLGGCMYGRGR